MVLVAVVVVVVEVVEVVVQLVQAQVVEEEAKKSVINEHGLY